MVRRGTQLAAGIGLLVVAILVALFALGGGATGADAETCARFALQSQVRERLVTGQGSRVVVIGDSYSVGLGLQRTQGSWPTQLPGRVHVFGFSGSGFSSHASDCPNVSYDVRAPRALRDPAELVVVEGGLNDYDQPVSSVRSGFRALIAELSGRQVVVVGPPSAPARADGARQVDRVLREESELAGVRFVSMLRHHFDYLDDELHLTPAGHRAFGDAVAAALRH